MRVKRGVTSHKRHNKIRKATKGMSHPNRVSIKRGRQAVTKVIAVCYPRSKEPQANIPTSYGMLVLMLLLV